jgi:hypothetical protein
MVVSADVGSRSQNEKFYPFAILVACESFQQSVFVASCCSAC